MRPNRLLAAGCATAGLALCAGLPASAGAAATSAPVIHESFTALPCPSKPTNTVQIEGCAEHKILAGDKQIDALNAKIFAKLTKSGRAGFITGSADWLKYRNTSCDAVASIYSGGTLEPVADANCDVSINTTHITELKQMMVSLSPEG
jgi:uncharacterized protein YecT (DUF1311 family)